MSNKTNSVISKKDDKLVSVKEIKSTIKDLKKKLDEQIESYQRKAKLIADRDQFISTRENIMEYIKDQGVDFDPSMENRRLSLKLTDNRSYRDENIVLIKNNAVIRDMMGILLARINEKIAEIEKEILD